MVPIRIRRADDIRDRVSAAYDAHRRVLTGLLPRAEIEHVGATAVPGALTKGDLDLLVRVEEADFSSAIDILSTHYAIHQPHNWTPTLASFKDSGTSEPAVGVQLVVAGSADDRLFGPFRDALIRDPTLLAEYNALKQRLDGEEYESYTEQKGEFVERVLREISDSPAGASPRN